MKLERTDWLKKFIKLFISNPKFYKQLQAKKSDKRAVFIGSPVHSNLGDHLIAIECIDYIQSLGFREVVEIQEFTYELFSNKVKVDRDDVIFIAAGGWMGDLYEDELVVEDILSRWNKNRIVILPQTIYFKGTGLSTPERLNNIMKQVTDLTVCVRDRRSYDYCKDILQLSDLRCLLLPDIALRAMKDIRTRDRTITNRILLSLRNDAEKVFNSDIDRLKVALGYKGYRLEDASTLISQKIVKINDRKNVIQKKIEEFTEADLVITDRLHSMVFALLAGTKCVAIDNATHKVIGVAREWLNNYPGLIVTDEISKIPVEEIISLIDSNDYPKAINFDNEFSRLTDLIRGA